MRTSIMLVKVAAVFRGGRPLLSSLRVEGGIPVEADLVASPRRKNLTADDHLFITWPASFLDFTLQSITELSATAQWNDLPAGTLNSAEVRVPVDNEGLQQFYRVVEMFPNRASF